MVFHINKLFSYSFHFVPWARLLNNFSTTFAKKWSLHYPTIGGLKLGKYSKWLAYQNFQLSEKVVETFSHFQ